MSYILAFLLIAVPEGFLHLSVTSEEKDIDLCLPLSLIEYTDMFIEGEMSMAEVLKETELHIGDILVDIDTEEEKVLMVIVGKDEILKQGEKIPKWFRIEIKDKKEGKTSIKIPLWAFEVLSNFGVHTMDKANVAFLNALTESIEGMGGGRFRFLEVRDKESSIDLYVE